MLKIHNCKLIKSKPFVIFDKTDSVNEAHWYFF